VLAGIFDRLPHGREFDRADSLFRPADCLAFNFVREVGQDIFERLTEGLILPFPGLVCGSADTAGPAGGRDCPDARECLQKCDLILRQAYLSSTGQGEVFAVTTESPLAEFVGDFISVSHHIPISSTAGRVPKSDGETAGPEWFITAQQSSEALPEGSGASMSVRHI
jgi:hypothetical protein